ncbi:hypothetical protein ABV409_01170 [Flagellimonas sp. DF-77]|uniref:hypothetical protein n=1 Tax=Flagellimonas algarum TaxID=3230298 RepID=UPI00339B962C
METEKEHFPTNRRQDTNRIMGIAAIVISVFSMFAVIYQSYLAREENRLMRIQQSASVLPYLSHWYSDIDHQLKFVIENKGVGPAFIKEVRFRALDPKTKDTLVFASSDLLYRHLKKHSPLIDSLAIIKSSFRQNMLLAQGESISVYNFPFEDEAAERRLKIAFYGLFPSFQIRYEDVYGASWLLDSEKGYPVAITRP